MQFIRILIVVLVSGSLGLVVGGCDGSGEAELEPRPQGVIDNRADFVKDRKDARAKAGENGDEKVESPEKADSP